MSAEVAAQQRAQTYLATPDGTREGRCPDCAEAITVVRTRYFTRGRGRQLITGVVETVPGHSCPARREVAS